MYSSNMSFSILTMLSNGGNGECFNLSSPEGVGFNELADKNKPILNDDVDIVPDVSKSQSKLILNMTYRLEESVDQTIQ
jgi:hypothetical protein